MGQEIRYWQQAAERSKIRADQLAQENEASAAGYKHCGRASSEFASGQRQPERPD
jgi:hypothetical protein